MHEYGGAFQPSSNYTVCVFANMTTLFQHLPLCCGIVSTGSMHNGWQSLFGQFCILQVEQLATYVKRLKDIHGLNATLSATMVLLGKVSKNGSNLC